MLVNCWPMGDCDKRSRVPDSAAPIVLLLSSQLGDGLRVFTGEGAAPSPTSWPFAVERRPP